MDGKSHIVIFDNEVLSVTRGIVCVNTAPERVGVGDEISVCIQIVSYDSLSYGYKVGYVYLAVAVIVRAGTYRVICLTCGRVFARKIKRADITRSRCSSTTSSPA